jgi:hypothetical protein
MALTAEEQANDAIVEACQTKFAAAYGAGFTTINWQAIITAILSAISGCVVPTPANIRAQFQRPLKRAQLLKKLVEMYGVSGVVASKSITAFGTVLAESSDAELTTFVAAAQETA